MAGLFFLRYLLDLFLGERGEKMSEENDWIIYQRIVDKMGRLSEAKRIKLWGALREELLKERARVREEVKNIWKDYKKW